MPALDQTRAMRNQRMTNTLTSCIVVIYWTLVLHVVVERCHEVLVRLQQEEGPVRRSQVEQHLDQFLGQFRDGILQQQQRQGPAARLRSLPRTHDHADKRRQAGIQPRFAQEK